MPPKSRIDHKKAEAERLQALVIDLLREDENKYCADCEAKQPRWASWNLGVFLCIRCAGIHRNLGVHLSKVKSVNLDSWTAEQVQSMRVMGNAKAKAVYEAELPDHFRRPQTDQALESFIRAKYEHKRYMLKDWSPPRVDVRDLPPPPEKHRHSNDRAAATTKSGPSKVTIPLGAAADKLNQQLPSPSGSSSIQSNAAAAAAAINEAPLLLDLASPASQVSPPTTIPPKQSPNDLLLTKKTGGETALRWGDQDTNNVEMQSTTTTTTNGLSSSVVETTFETAAHSSADPLEDMFGPIVSAAPPLTSSGSTSLNAPTPDVAASTSNSNTLEVCAKQTILPTGNLGDLASITLTATTTPEAEKKSNSDILALFECAPRLPSVRGASVSQPQPQQPQSQQQQQQQIPAQFAQVMNTTTTTTTNDMSNMFANFGGGGGTLAMMNQQSSQQLLSQQQQQQQQQQVGGFYAPNIIPHSQPAYGPSPPQFTTNPINTTTTISPNVGGAFMSRETAAAFAAASPFANPPSMLLSSCHVPTLSTTTNVSTVQSANANNVPPFGAFADLQSSLQMQNMPFGDIVQCGGGGTSSANGSSGTTNLGVQRMQPMNSSKNTAYADQTPFAAFQSDSLPKTSAFVADFSRLGLDGSIGETKLGALEEENSSSHTTTATAPQTSAILWD